MIFIVIAKKVSFGDTPNRKKIDSKLLYCLLHNVMLCLPQQLHSPTTVSSKTWLILGLVDTWHSKSPASEAFVNLSLSVFWPRLRWRTLRLLNVLYKIYKFLQPARHELEPLVVDVFLFSNKQWISVAGSHPGNLGRTQSQYRVKRFSLDCHFYPLQFIWWAPSRTSGYQKSFKRRFTKISIHNHTVSEIGTGD